VEPKQLANSIIEVLEENKAEDIVLMDLEKVSNITSLFVICTGSSDRMIEALADHVIDGIRENHKLKSKPMGEAASGWVIVDYGSVILHCFTKDTREYYNLEELWKEGKVLLRIQ